LHLNYEFHRIVAINLPNCMSSGEGTAYGIDDSGFLSWFIKPKMEFKTQ
jgi:hypothetical protein